MNTVLQITRAFIFLVLASFASTAFSSTVSVRAESGILQSLDGVWAHSGCLIDHEPPDPGEFDTQEVNIFHGNAGEGRVIQYASKDGSCSGAETIIRSNTGTVSATGELESPGWVLDDELVPPPPRQDGNGLLDATPLVTTVTVLQSDDEIQRWLLYIDDTAEIWYLYSGMCEEDICEDDELLIFMDPEEPLIKIDLVLSPIPIPAAFWLFGTALLGFIGVSRRRKVA